MLPAAPPCVSGWFQTYLSAHSAGVRFSSSIDVVDSPFNGTVKQPGGRFLINASLVTADNAQTHGPETEDRNLNDMNHCTFIMSSKSQTFKCLS